MKKTLLAIVAMTAFITGCSSTSEYRLYAETQQKIAQAQAQAHATAEAARYAALAEIAKNGDATARVAAAMSLSFAGNNGGQSIMRQQPVNPPVSFGDKALQWTSVLLPSFTQMYGINANRQVAITQSNNQAAVATSTNNTFAAMNAAGHNANVSIANKGFDTVGQTAAAGLTATQNVATAGITGIVTTSANGLTAATSISNSANTAITNVSNAANTSIQTLSTQIPNLQPNVTNTTTSTTSTSTTNQCGSNAAGGTVTCP